MPYQASPCVRSGFCCKTATCSYGETDPQLGYCKYLISETKGDDFEFFKCGRYEYIIQQPGNEFMPAFGYGCCMAMFNEARRKNIQAILSKVVDFKPELKK